MQSWLIVGLGNPGPEYEWTPHNVGFLTVDRFAARNGLRISRPECQSLVGVGDVKGDRVIVAKPLTFMNLSGAAVKQIGRACINPGSPLGSGPIVLGEKARHFVLAVIPKSMRADLDLWLDEASSSIESIIAEGAEKAMTRFNRRAQGSKEEEK
ncbi:MAG: aminoacyl-tRNA hydrolase [Acidobacteria bacterium]|nr:aminoacyl-tRNA hydrolase [Acidobacteriota bacterium]